MFCDAQKIATYNKVQIRRNFCISVLIGFGNEIF